MDFIRSAMWLHITFRSAFSEENDPNGPLSDMDLFIYGKEILS